ncbi:hypothetical protein DFH06DRAFT_1330962 [Mycena polygramma]|nr:hypothetical protein DFH06DRAFT_1330962 [Mycena polygramma]
MLVSTLLIGTASGLGTGEAIFLVVVSAGNGALPPIQDSDRPRSLLSKTVRSPFTRPGGPCKCLALHSSVKLQALWLASSRTQAAKAILEQPQASNTKLSFTKFSAALKQHLQEFRVPPPIKLLKAIFIIIVAKTSTTLVAVTGWTVTLEFPSLHSLVPCATALPETV